jgi:hypothetical protein
MRMVGVRREHLVVSGEGHAEPHRPSVAPKTAARVRRSLLTAQPEKQSIGCWFGKGRERMDGGHARMVHRTLATKVKSLHSWTKLNQVLFHRI